MSRNKSYIALINSMSWRRLRHEMLCKHPMCQMCESEGRERFATEVHHIRPIESIEDKELQQSLAFDRDNLMCVCHECHVLAHRRLLSHVNQGRRSKERASREAIEKLFGEDPGGVFFYRGRGQFNPTPPTFFLCEEKFEFAELLWRRKMN